MTPENDKYLVEQYPFLYTDRYAEMAVTCMCFGFECGNGWFDLIHRLSAKLEELIKVEHDNQTVCWMCEKAKEEHPHAECDEFEYRPLRAAQVKEKFGTLRFYMVDSTEEMQKVIDLAESDSAFICESCGDPGKVTQKNRWLRTRCDKCAA